MKNKLQSYEKRLLIMISLGIILMISSLSFIIFSITTNYLAKFTMNTLNSTTSTLAIFALVFFL